MSTIRGRFQKDADKLVQRYKASIPFDQRLYQHDIAGSLAHAKMLAKQSIITDKEAELIGMGLVSIREEIEKRIGIAQDEIKAAKLYNHTVINQSLDQAVLEIEEIILNVPKQRRTN